MKNVLQVVIFLLMLPCFMIGQSSFQDDFSDGDFTNNPQWLGDVSKYIVTGAANELRINDLGTGASAQLYVPINIQDSTTWEFLIRLALTTTGPSSSNRVRVYLQSDNSNFAAATLNGYYLQIGETGSLDAIEIFKVTNGVATSILRGTDGLVSGATINARVRVVRDNAGNWQLFADYAGGTSYVSEGTATDATHNSGSYFGVYTTYSSTQGDKFFYDDFLVSPLFVDVTPPNLLSATAISATQVDVLFDEALDPLTANNALNYTINNGISVSNAQLDGSNPALVHLTVSALTSQTTYQLTVVNVEDLSGNAISTANTNFTYILTVTAALHDVLFNEIMIDPNPVVNLPDAEYIELYNRSNAAIDLTGFSLTHRSASSQTGTTKVLDSYILLPNEYLLLHNDANYLPLANDMQIPALPALNNTSAYLILRDTAGLLIDSILYDISWYRDGNKDDGGWSLELINPNLICKGANNWIASNSPNGGTPGLVNSVFDNTPDNTAPAILQVQQVGNNQVILTFDDVLDSISAVTIANYSINGGLSVVSVQWLSSTTVQLTFNTAMTHLFNYTITTNISDCVGNVATRQISFTYVLIGQAGFQDLILNEIMIDPDPVVNLPDAEYIELYNRSNAAIDLTGYEIVHRSASTGTETIKTLGTYLLLPDEYVILHDSPNYIAASNDLQIASFPALNNTGAYLILRDSSGANIDSILYDVSWYQDGNKDDGGWSMELINPNLICKGGNNWIASNSVDGGTPGAINSVYDTALDTVPPVISLARQSDINKAILVFDDILDPIQAGNIGNYSVSGGLTVVFVQQLDLYSVELTFNINMIANASYTVTTNNIGDCVGNNTTRQASFIYLETSPALHYDVIINEIFPDANPTVGLPEQEFVELYNRSAKNINLEGYSFTDGTSTQVSIFPFHILKPGDYLILYKTGGASFSAFGEYIEFSLFPDLNATGDNLVLYDANSNVIDAVSYDDSWFNSSTKAEGGWSLERINPNSPCEGRENWAASVAQPPAFSVVGGTPGEANSVLQNIADSRAPDAFRAFPFGAANHFDADSIRVYFSEAMGDSASVNLLSYDLNNGLAIVEAYLEPPFNNTIVLITDAPLQDNVIYTLFMNNNLTDCVGNAIGLNNEVQFALPQQIEKGDLILNEILFNPVVGGVDYIELYNNSTKIVNIGDLYISNTENDLLNDANDVTFDYLVFPGQYIVLTDDPAQVEATYRTNIPEMTPDYEKMVEFGLPSFADDEGTILVYAVYNDTNTIFVDSFYYHEDYQSPLIDDLNGVALERIDFDAATTDAANWHSAAQPVHFGTPTYLNSSARNNEITDDGIIQLPNNTFSPDGDGYEDFLLINYNIDEIGFVGDISVYDAHGRFIKQLVDNELLLPEGTVQWDGSTEKGEKAIIGPYIIVAKLFNPSGKTKLYKKTCVLAGQLGN